jgi:hypothetical protein
MAGDGNGVPPCHVKLFLYFSMYVFAELPLAWSYQHYLFAFAEHLGLGGDG